MSGRPAHGPALWTAADAAAATHGHAKAPWRATGVSIDTRTLKPGELFVAIRGERFDGHDFLDDAFAAGAAAAMVSRIPQNQDEDHPLLIVDDTYVGLLALARAARERADAKIIGITGSVGKTSTKEALAAALAASGPVTASEGNLNNRWGVPLSLARMPADAAYGVFEIAMNHAGEITPLSRLVGPDIAIVTTVEAVHLEFFDSVDEIALAKAEIFDGMSASGAAILNRDNRFFPILAEEAEARGITRIVGFGESVEAEARLIEFRANGPARVKAVILGREIEFTLALPGRHSAQNTMAVLAAVQLAGADLTAAAAALETMATPAGRGRRITIQLAGGGTATLIDDTYNAAPASMRAAFRVLAESEPGEGGRRIAVLGDMLELGPGSALAHEELAPELIAAKVDLVLTTGDNMMHLDDTLPRDKRGGHTVRAEDLVPLIEGVLAPGDVVLIKASHGQRLGRVVDALMELRGPRKTAVNGG